MSSLVFVVGMVTFSEMQKSVWLRSRKRSTNHLLFINIGFDVQSVQIVSNDIMMKFGLSKYTTSFDETRKEYEERRHMFTNCGNDEGDSTSFQL